MAERYREGWRRAGRPRAGNLSRGAYAAATLHGLRGDDRARAVWLDIVDALQTPGRTLAAAHFGEFFDALLLIHRGRPHQAMELLTIPPEELNQWYSAQWRPWYAAVWAEAAVLSKHADAAGRLERARRLSSDNPVASAIVARAAVLADGSTDDRRLNAVATAFDEAGCRYQWARTLVLMGGRDRCRGEQALAAMGASAMVWPPEPG